MTLFRQEEIRPAAETPWAQAIECVAGTGGVTKNDIVILNDVAATSSLLPKAVKADADGTGLVAGMLFVATGTVAAGEKFLAVPWKVITGVDTSAASNGGDPVYLDVTAGGWTATAPSGADDSPIIVGSVLAVSASVGAVMLAPAMVSAAGLVKRGTVTILNTATAPAADPTLSANFSGGLVLASFVTDPGNDVSVFATMNTTTLEVRTTALVAADTTIAYVVYSAAL